MLQETHILQYGSKTIEYNLLFTTRKSLGIKVLPEGTVTVIAPMDSTLTDITEKLKSKSQWILKQQAFFNQYKPIASQRKFINGETHLYLGRQYKLKTLKGKEDNVKIYRGIMTITAKNISPLYLKNILNEWYRSKAILLFDELLHSSLEKFKKYKIQKPILCVKQMQKRWGSCTKSGKILLNTELIKAPKTSIHYVVIHELCHLVHHNHTKDFYGLQNKLLPQWEKWKDQLEHSLS